MTITDFTAELDRRGYAYTTDGAGVTVTHKGLVSLTTLPKGTVFENGDSVYLDRLTSLPEGTVFNNRGFVSLYSLPALPDDVVFNNRGRVYLESLTGQHVYRGAVRDFRNIDGLTMLMGPSTLLGEYTVHFARYFMGREITDMPTCYVAERDGVTAHGESVKEAIEDLEYKLADAADKTAIARAVIGAGRVTLSQFRALTGACREGVRQHLAEAGIDLSTIDSMDLTTALKTMAGTSFGDVFEKYLEQEEIQ